MKEIRKSLKVIQMGETEEKHHHQNHLFLGKNRNTLQRASTGNKHFTEKEIFKLLNSIDSSLAQKYVIKRSLKSLALSPNDNLFSKAKKEIMTEFNPKGINRLQILVLSTINILVRILNK